MVRPLLIQALAALLVLLSASVRGQTPLFDQTSEELQSGQAAGFTAVSPYRRPPVAHYRLMGGFGGNLGLASDAPRAMIGVASYQMGEVTHGISDCFSAAFISDAGNSRVPRKTFSEFDVLYGYGINEEVAGYESAPQFFHASISAGLGYDTYSARWRRFGRGVIDTTNTPPNTFEYSLGVPLQIQASYEPFRYLGIGALLFLNVNAIAPNYGAAVMLEVRY